LAKCDSELRPKVEELIVARRSEKDIKRLSDANDALTKRLNDLETKQKQAKTEALVAAKNPRTIEATNKLLSSSERK
jgi:hypothetical protein